MDEKKPPKLESGDLAADFRQLLASERVLERKEGVDFLNRILSAKE